MSKLKTVKVVIGANFGDEGKGLATDYFANKAMIETNKSSLIVLSNGGSQRGHTVVLPSGERHVFHHFGSGTFHCGDTYVPKYFIVNPMVWVNEYSDLLIDYKYKNKFFINKNCPLTTPFDMIANQIIEESRGANRHGSCGLGIWETILRDGLTVGEMADLHDSDKVEYLHFVRNRYFAERISSKNIKISNVWKQILNEEGLISHYINDFNLMISKSIFVNDDEILKSDNYDWIIFENGQGLLLDKDISGYGKNTTPSNTGVKNPSEMMKSINCDSIELCYVSRPYITRHGAGRLDNECRKDEISSKIREDATNKTNQFQGNFRYGILDPDDLYKRINSDSIHCSGETSYFFTHVDECDIPKRFYDEKLYTSFGPSITHVQINQ